MTLQQILYFTEIAKTGQFTQAAQNLYVSQSTLSYAIQALERELGVPLFIRRKSSKQMEMSAYGKSFLPYCEKAISLLDDGQKEIDLLKNPTSGVVSVAYSYINCHQLVPKLFNDFYSDHKEDYISIQFFVNHERAELEEEVITGKVDLGFACTPAYEGLESIPVARQELVCFLSADHPLAGAEKLRLEDIQDEQILGYYPNSNLHFWINKMFKYSNLRPNILTDYQDWSSQLVYVSLNRGITISPWLPVDSDQIVMVPLDHPMNARPVYLIHAKEQKLSSAAEYVKQYCLEWSNKQFGSLKGPTMCEEII